jgi:hypothetical protein
VVEDSDWDNSWRIRIVFVDSNAQPSGKDIETVMAENSRNAKLDQHQVRKSHP